MPEKLIKAFKNAGNSSFAIGIFMPIAFPVSVYIIYLLDGNFNLIGFAITYVLLLAFMAYFIYAGLKVKNDNFSEPKKSYNTALLLMVVSLFSIFVFAPGGILLLFYIAMIINNIVAFSQIKKYNKSFNI